MAEHIGYPKQLMQLDSASSLDEALCAVAGQDVRGGLQRREWTKEVSKRAKALFAQGHTPAQTKGHEAHGKGLKTAITAQGGAGQYSSTLVYFPSDPSGYPAGAACASLLCSAGFDSLALPLEPHTVGAIAANVWGHYAAAGAQAGAGAARTMLCEVEGGMLGVCAACDSK